MAKLSTVNSAVGEHCAAFMDKLRLNRANASILVISDSTFSQENAGPNVKHPPLRLLEYIAPLFPATTVNFRQWDQTAGANQSDGKPMGAYSALGSGKSQVIQTGTGTGNAGGPFVLDMYNMAASGTTLSYAMIKERWATIIAPFSGAPPDVVIINHGHNLGSGGATSQRHATGGAVRAVKTLWPLATILLVAQNPTDPARGGYDPLDLLRAGTISSIAAETGSGLVDIFGRFLENPDWVTEWLSDGLHLNDAGDQVAFEDCLKPHFKVNSRFTQPASPKKESLHVYVPATAFHKLTGNPVLDLVNSETMMWALPPGEISAIQVDLLLPVEWNQFDAWVHWCVSGSSGYTTNTTCAFRIKRQQRSGNINLPASQAIWPVPVATDPGVVARNPNGGTPYQTIQSQLIGQGTPLKAITGYQLFRDGLHAQDQLPSDTIYIKGLQFIKSW